MKKPLGLWLGLLGLPLQVTASPTRLPAHAESLANLIKRAQALSEADHFDRTRQLIEARVAQAQGDTRTQPLHNALADVHYARREQMAGEAINSSSALVHYCQAYESDKTLQCEDAGSGLIGMGVVYSNSGWQKDARSCFVQALPLFREAKNQEQQAYALAHLGDICTQLKRFPKALQFYQQARSLFRQMKNQEWEAYTLNASGDISRNLGRPQEALRFYNLAVPLYHALKDRREEAFTLIRISEVYVKLNQREQVFPIYNRMLPLFHALKDREREATTLTSMGVVYALSGRFDQALPFYNKALFLVRQVKNRGEEATLLRATADAYSSLGQYESALRCYNQALLLFGSLKNLGGQVEMLNNIGLVYNTLGRPQEALRYYQQALPGVRALKDPKAQAVLLNDIGLAYDALKQPRRALTFYNQSLPLMRAIKDPKKEGAVLNNMGMAYRALGQDDRALPLYNRALSLSRTVKDREGEAIRLVNIAGIYSAQGRYEPALAFFKEGWRISHAIKDRAREVLALGNLMDFYRTWKQPGVAIVFGKQAVNLAQSIRRDIRNLDKESQRTYLAQNRWTYTVLASLLTQANRLEEAEQILRFLRQEDAVEFARRDPALGRELATLFQPLVYTKAEKSHLPLDVAASATIGEGAGESLLWQQALAQRERAGAGRAALLSAFYTDDTFTLLLTTAKERRAFSVPIKKVEFDALSLRLQDELSRPTKDPRPDAQKMYQIVFAGGELEQALQEEGITVALWFTSGSLRTIPIDALYDGKQYLVQKERANVNVTLTSRLRFNDISHGPTLAVGVSLAHTVGSLTKGETPMPFGALSNVPKEVRSIVQDPADGGTGPFPGKILLDKEFTAANLERSLSQGASTVHIATHFSLDATGDQSSFFLLGDGTALPLSQWKEALKLKGVGLLTLSACETGVGSPDATGGEVSSIGEVSQYLGAQSVIVSLWSVADASTATLMGDFYTRLHNAPDQGKALALREAQRALLGNEADAPLAQGERGKPQQEDGTDNDTSAPPFVKDLKHPYAHPFYWAPFSLIGNWK